AFPRNRQKKHRKIATFPMFHSFFTARGMKGINYFRFFDASVLPLSRFQDGYCPSEATSVGA
ncbi:MAG: hypothetical protein IJ584_07925, partial [Bacteroidales bacterium]|nr:hypothetical protein [Bacteroidales bacterium]